MGDVREFLDTVYVAWPRTTCVETGYWEARKVGDTFEVVAVNREQEEQVVATGLAEGSAYKVRVSAENLLGVGEPLHTTAPIVAKLPYDPPSAPTQPHVIDSDASFIQLKWAKPSSDGGNAIQGYLVEAKQAGSPDWV